MSFEMVKFKSMEDSLFLSFCRTIQMCMITMYILFDLIRNSSKNFILISNLIFAIHFKFEILLYTWLYLIPAIKGTARCGISWKKINSFLFS